MLIFLLLVPPILSSDFTLTLTSGQTNKIIPIL